MAATVVVKEWNGAGPTATTITLGRFCTKDMYNAGDTFPCVVPASSFNYSYWKHFALEFSGSFNKINNIRFHGSGNTKSNWEMGTGGMMMVCRRDSGANGCPIGDYAQAAGVEGESGYFVADGTNGHPYYKGQTVQPTDVDTYNSGNPLLIDDTDITSEGTSFATVLQLKIAPDAIQGEQPNEELVWLFDEQ
jgi:hypothetical protein